MTENLGSIRYDVEVNTTEMLRAEGVVNKSTSKIESDFKKAENSTKSFNTQATKTSQGVKKAFGGNLGQAGIQVQQFAGQLQGGQSAMVALAQQSADLGIVLGAPLIGVFVSLAAVLAGTLAPAVFGSASNIEKLQKAIENTKAVMTIGADGVAEYTDEIKKLNTASEALAKIKIALAMTQNAEALKASKKEASALRAELIGFQEDATDAAERLTGLTSSTSDILNITGAMKDFNSATSDDKKLKALDAAEQAILNMRKNGVFPTKELAEYAAEFFNFSDATRQVIENNKALKTSQDALNESNSISEGSFNDMKNALIGNIIELKSGEKAALKWSLLMSGLDANQQAEILTLFDKKKALEEANQATEDAIKANERYEKSVIKQTESDLAWFEQQEQWLKDSEKSERIKLTTQVQSVGLTPLEQIEERYQAEKALLEQAEAEKIEIVGTYAERYKQIEAEKQEAIRGLQGNTSEFMENAFGNLDTQISGALGSVVLGAQTGEEALKGLARTILTQVVGALIQQQVTSALVSAGFIAQKGAETAAVVGGVGAQAAAATAATAATTAATVASGAAITAAMAPAAAATSIATAGAAPAAASGIALSTIGLIIGGLLGATALSGGREFGGPVSAGSMYRVGEKGKPEFFKDNLGKLSMIPGENGEVIPANKMGGGSGGMTVQVNNYTPYQVYVTQDQASNIARVEIGNEAGKLQKGRGSMYNAMKSGGNYSNNAKR